MASIKHIKQGHNECFPTVLAMLSGVDVNKIIADSKALSPTVHSWSDAVSVPSKLGELTEVELVYRALARKYAPYLLEHVAPVNVKEMGDRKAFLSYGEFRELTRLGKGAVILCSRYISMPAGHIAAYEQGLIYCGNMEGPVSSHEYYKWLATKTPMCPVYVIPEF